MKAIYKHELSTYFSTMTGYIFCAFILLFAGIYMLYFNLYNQYNTFAYVFGSMGFVFLVAVPILTMRVMAEERKQKTDQLLYSLPVSATEVVLGKYLALITVLFLAEAVVCIYPLILQAFGPMNFRAVYGAAVAFFFMGCAYLAIGLFVSSVTDSQILAAGLAFVILLVNYFLGNIAEMFDSKATSSLVALLVAAAVLGFVIYLMTKSISAGVCTGITGAALVGLVYRAVPNRFEGLFPKILKSLSINLHMNRFMYSTFSLADIVFFISVSVLFVYLTVQSLEKRRWS